MSVMRDPIKEMKEEIVSKLQSYIRTEEEIKNDTKPYDVDHMYEYGQQDELEHAIEIVKDVFNDFGF